jgi:acyl carrier protein
MSKEEIKNWLEQWFINKAKIAPTAIGGHGKQSLFDIDYFEAGWLTSMEVVEFVTEIERHFSMQFSDHDLQDSRFVTIAGLAALISESTESSQRHVT